MYFACMPGVNLKNCARSVSVFASVLTQVCSLCAHYNPYSFVFSQFACAWLPSCGVDGRCGLCLLLSLPSPFLCLSHDTQTPAQMEGGRERERGREGRGRPKMGGGKRGRDRRRGKVREGTSRGHTETGRRERVRERDRHTVEEGGMEWGRNRDVSEAKR